MKKVSSAKLITKPSQFIATAEIANADQVISAREMPCQSGVSAFGRLAIVVPISASDSTTMTTPYQSGKNAGPGPSSL